MQHKVSPKLEISKLTIKKLLTHIETKKDLTKYLSNLCSERLMQQKREFVISVDSVSFGSLEFSNNNHEEADTLIVLHATLASSTTALQPRIVIFSLDTDVLVLLVSHATKLSKECYLHTCYLHVLLAHAGIVNIHTVRENLGEQKSKAFGLHALTGCDTVGKLAGETKTSWWNGFLKADSSVLTALSQIGEDYIEDYIEHLVRFTLEDARWYLFCNNPDQCEKCLQRTGHSTSIFYGPTSKLLFGGMLM